MSGGEDTSKRERWRRVGAILDAVLDAPEQSREQVLAERCAGDPALRAEVEAMLAAESRPDRRLDSPVGVWANALLSGDDESAETVPGNTAGERIGPYRLVRELGRGGMGTVWLAERADGQFEQQVALKLLKRGLDSEAILARFLEERRILASLRHPHIAQLLDGGIASDGRPYYALEYIDGALITKWCDGRKLGVRERLSLFLDVVEAVQYAHQRLIVHRDLKPGNVMVSSAGEVKLLDFGIAKVLDPGQAGAEAATLTNMGWRMLTPEYAAPEQLRGDPATTATDVYALGVLLHELLTGARPEAATGREQETARPTMKPSTRVSDEAAAVRGANPDRLRRMLRGDLDVIVLKALKPEPERRYGSAQGLADDIRRYLNGAPVRARPDSPWYRARRFVTRHRWGTAAAVLVVLSLVTGALVAGWQAREARRQALEAKKQMLEAEKQTRRAEQVKDFLVKIFEASGPLEWKGKEPTARDLLEAGAKRVDDELRGDPALRAEMLAVIGDLFLGRGQLDRAEGVVKHSMDERRRLFGEDHEQYAESLYSWAYLLYRKGDYQGSEQAITRAVSIFRRRLGDHRLTAKALGGLSNIRQVAGQVDEAIRLRREALAIDRRLQGGQHRDVAHDLTELALMLVVQRRYDEARPLLDESLAIRRRLYGINSTAYATGLNAQARLLSETGDLEAAAVGFRDAAEIFRQADDPSSRAVALNNQGDALCRMGRFVEAERRLREALDVRKSFASPVEVGKSKGNLGRCLNEAGWPSKAEPLLREAAGIMQDNFGQNDRYVFTSARDLALALAQQGRVAEAMSVVRPGMKLSEAARGQDRVFAAEFLVTVGRLQFLAGDEAKGLAMLQEALQELRDAGAGNAQSIGSAVVDLADLELQGGHAQQAQAHLREVAPTLEGGIQRPKGLRARMLHGVALTQLDRLDEGEQILREVLEQRRKMYGEDNARTAEARLYLGICLLRQGKDDEGRSLIDQGREGFSRQFGINHHVIRLADKEMDRRQ